MKLEAHTTPGIFSLLLIIKKIALAIFLPQDTIFAGKPIMKHPLPPFASAWLPPWPVCRACKSMREID